MILSAQQVYDKLLNEDKILQLEGQIKFYLGDVSIVVRQRDVVGNIMQEWLQGWLDAREIEYAPSENTQMPPDFFLNPNDKTKNLLEVKAFNRNAGPGFDIADFRMYQREIIREPYMLDVDYLIFGYDMSDDGIVTIKDVWLKKVWQITRRMENWPLNLQIKQNVVHKIRPGVWYSDGSGRTDYAIFERMEDFISAVDETVFRNPDTRVEAGTWLESFLRSYKDYSGVDLDIPRWTNIKDKYDIKTTRKHNMLLKDLENAKISKEQSFKKLKLLNQKYDEIVVLKDNNKIEKIKKDIEKEQIKANKLSEKVQSLEEDLGKFK